MIETCCSSAAKLYSLQKDFLHNVGVIKSRDQELAQLDKQLQQQTAFALRQYASMMEE